MERIVDLISKYHTLDNERLEELYDQVDNLYNELVTKYTDALTSPDANKETVDRVLELAKILIAKENRTIEEDLILIAILDIIATDLHFRLYGGFVEYTEEE